MSSALPSDIVDQLLAASPDFDALDASIKVSKAWREAYEAHPTTIALAVARNMVGESLPQAVRFLRYPYPEKDDNTWPRDADEEEDEEDSEEDSEDEERDGARGKPKRQKKIKLPRRSLSESAQIGELTSEERKKLQENAAIVAQLEALFSSRCVCWDLGILRGDLSFHSGINTADTKPASSHRSNRAASRARCTASCCIASCSTTHL